MKGRLEAAMGKRKKIEIVDGSVATWGQEGVDWWWEGDPNMPPDAELWDRLPCGGHWRRR